MKACDQPTVLETERLRLREMTPDDLDFLATLLADPEVMRFYPRRYDRTEAAAWLQRTRERYARDGHAHWLVLEKATCRPLGQVGLIEQEKEGLRFTEVGYMLARDAWGRGYATEAASACVRHGFDVLGRERIHAMILPENLPSRHVAQRLGMRAERQVVHAGLLHDLFFVDRG